MAGAGRFGDHAGAVLVAAAGHAHVEVLGHRGRVGEEHGPVDGDAFRLVDGHGVGQGHVVGHVVGGKDDPAPVPEMGDGHRAVGVAGIDAPAVAVADPDPGEW